jgi:hypothetical protein
MFILHNIFSFSNYEKFMNRMLRNLYTIKPGMFTDSITINLCLTKHYGRNDNPLQSHECLPQIIKQHDCFGSRSLRGTVYERWSAELEVAAALRAQNIRFWAIALPRRFCQACLFRRKLDHPVFTLDFATVFFFTEQGRQPCVQPHPGGSELCIYVPQWQGGPVIPPGSGFPFCCLLRFAALWWRYSNLPPHGTVQTLPTKEYNLDVSGGYFITKRVYAPLIKCAHSWTISILQIDDN